MGAFYFLIVLQCWCHIESSYESFFNVVPLAVICLSKWRNKILKYDKRNGKKTSITLNKKRKAKTTNRRRRWKRVTKKKTPRPSKNTELSSGLHLSCSQVYVCLYVLHSISSIVPSLQFFFFIFYLHEAHYLILFRFIFHIYRNLCTFFFSFFNVFFSLA